MSIKVNESTTAAKTVNVKKTQQTDNNVVTNINFIKSTVEKLPAEQNGNLEKQVDTVLKNAKVKLKKIPAPFSLLGASKIQKDASAIMDDPKFRADVVCILGKSAEKPENANKDAIGLVRDKETYNQLFAYIKTRTKDSSVLSFILNNDAASSKLYEYINSDAALEFLQEA